MKSFVELTKFLLTKHPKLELLSERLSQDPLENYFGKQRQRGGRNEHPNIHQCLENAAALRIQGSTALDPVRGNCRRRKSKLAINEQEVINSASLPKRKRIRTIKATNK